MEFNKLIKLPEGKTHTDLLAEMLQLAHAGPGEQKELLGKNEKYYKHLGCMYDGKATNVHELLLSTTVESTTLLQTEVKQTLIEGANAMKCVRDAFPIYPMQGETMQINIGETSVYAPKVKQGSIIPVRTQDYSPVTFTAEKRALRPLITKEMIKFSRFPVIAQEVNFTGRALENALNREVVDKLLAGLAATAGYNTDFGGAGATPLTYINTAVTTIKNNGFLPDKVMFHPSCFNAYRVALNALNWDTGTMNNQSLPKVAGLTPYECGVTDSNATYEWGWGTDNYRGGLVYDSTCAFAIGMAEDITVEDFYDPIRQLQSMSCSIIFDAQCLQKSAMNLLQY